jgi:glycosyltransferase involved in cell wall biosynthesis
VIPIHDPTRIELVKGQMNICIVSTWIPSKKRPYSGIWVFDFAENLVKCGFKVTIIGPLGESDESSENSHLFSIYRVNSKLPIYSMFKIVNKIKPDIIHVHAPNFFSSNAIPIAKLKHIPIVATVHLGEVEPISNPLSFFRKHALARFSRIIAVSNHTKSLAVNAGAENSKISVIYNSCDETHFYCHKNKENARKELNLPADTKIILFVGDMIKRKGVFCLIESLHLLQKTIKQNFLAIFLGEGRELQNLKAMVDEYDIANHVKFIGNVTRPALANFYTAADVFVLPSFSEGHPVALLEAMASGLPIVASDIPANTVCIENGVNGFLFETGKVNKLAEKLAIILTDIKLQEMMSTNSSRIYLEKFSTRKQIEEHVKIYNSLRN